MLVVEFDVRFGCNFIPKCVSLEYREYLWRFDENEKGGKERFSRGYVTRATHEGGREGSKGVDEHVRAAICILIFTGERFHSGNIAKFIGLRFAMIFYASRPVVRAGPPMEGPRTSPHTFGPLLVEEGRPRNRRRRRRRATETRP